MKKLLRLSVAILLATAYSVTAFADVVWSPMDTIQSTALPVLLVLCVVILTVLLLIKLKKRKK